MNELLLDAVRKIRKDIGAISREPEIIRTKIIDGTLNIECEDRADKSIIIGTGGGVVGRLATSLSYNSITVESRLDTLLQLKRLMQTLSDLRSVDHSPLHTFITNWLLKLKPPTIDVIVAGEEYIWACGLFENTGSMPTLLHTGHLDKRIKDKYKNTNFVKIELDDTALRVDSLYDETIKYCEKNNMCSAVGPFYWTMKKEGNVYVADLQKCLSLTNWEAKRYEKKRYSPYPYSLRDIDRSFLITKYLEGVFDGTIEPNECAKIIITHWQDAPPHSGPGKKTRSEFVKRYRQKNTLKRAKQLSMPIHDALKSIIDGCDATQTDLRALVAWSGGTDSSACISLSKYMGFDTTAANVAMPHIDNGNLKEKALSLSCDVDVLEIPDGYEDIKKKALEGKIHPCGQCHALIDKQIASHAKENGYDIVIFGDMLSAGAQSVVRDDGLYIINLPAALALTKNELHSIENSSPTYTFGCPLLNCSHETCKNARKVSVQRVLRELRAQALDENYAYNLISDIMTTHTIAKQI